MQIQINTDHNIQGREALAARLGGEVKDALGRVAEHITRVEVHLSIESGGRSGQSDKRCVMEARMEGMQPLVVTEQAGSLDQAVAGAAGKMLRQIDSTLGRLRDRSQRGEESGQAEPELLDGLDEGQ